MVTVNNDNDSQLITVEYLSHVTAEEMSASAGQIRKALAGMRPGFRLLVDFTPMTAMDSDCAPIIASIMDVCNSAGVSHVSRVIPDMHKDIGVNILSRFHYGPEVVLSTHDDLATARRDLGI